MTEEIENENEATEELIAKIAEDAAAHRAQYELAEEAEKVAEGDEYEFWIVDAHNYESQIGPIEGVEFATDEEVELRGNLKDMLVSALEVRATEGRQEVSRMTSGGYIVPMKRDDD